MSSIVDLFGCATFAEMLVSMEAENCSEVFPLDILRELAHLICVGDTSCS